MLPAALLPPPQPMHTISAIALAAAGTAEPLTIPQIMAAGIFVSGVVLLLGVTQMAELFAWLVPPAVIRGVQLGVGVKVATKVSAGGRRFGPNGQCLCEVCVRYQVSSVWLVTSAGSPAVIRGMQLGVGIKVATDMRCGRGK
jgi:hypothetical protein